MNDQQKAVCRYLLDQSYRYGFDSSYDLKPIAEKLGVTVLDLYDENTNKGIMWEYGDYGNGFLHIRDDYASVGMDTRSLLEHWSDYKG